MNRKRTGLAAVSILAILAVFLPGWGQSKAAKLDQENAGASNCREISNRPFQIAAVLLSSGRQGITP